MDLALSESQNILVKAAGDFLNKEASGVARRLEKSPDGYAPDLWKRMADLGWMGILFQEEYGGTEGSFVDFILLVEEMGKALVPGPYIPTMIAGLAIQEYGTAKQKEELLPALISGNLILSTALDRPAPWLGERGISEEARIGEKEYVLSGTRLFVPFGHVADRILLVCDGKEVETLFLVKTDSPGVRCTPFESIANDKLCEVSLNHVAVEQTDVLGKREQSAEILQTLKEWGALAESAFIVGLAQRVLEMSVGYAKEREQFGRRIGSFQAVQHQCADMATDVERIRLLTYHAAWRLSKGGGARKEIAMAKSLASDASRRVCLLGVKLHGGTGVTEEHDMQLYFRRAKSAEQSFGDGDVQRDIIAEELGL